MDMIEAYILFLKTQLTQVKEVNAKEFFLSHQWLSLTMHGKVK